MPSLPRRPLLVVLLALGAWGSVGCRGKLPTGGECETLALAAVRVRTPRDLDDARILRAVQKITLECITTPYDREMVECVRRTSDYQGCAVRFKARASAPTFPVH